MRADNLLRPLAVTMSPIYFLLGLIVVNLALGEVTVLLGGTDTMHLDRPQDSSVLDEAEVFTGSFLISLKLIIFSKHPLPPKHFFCKKGTRTGASHVLSSSAGKD